MITPDISNHILSQMVTGVVVFDSSLRVVFINDWVSLRLQNPDHLLGTELTEAFPELDNSRFKFAVEDVIKNKLPAFLSNSFHPSPLPLFENPKDEASRIQQLLHIKPILYDEQVYCLVQVQDMSSSVAREQVLKRQQRDLTKSMQEAELANKMKSEFLATMSHEIRTPLNGMIGSTSLLNLTDMTSEQSELVATVRQCGENLLAIINDILDFSKIESGYLQLEETNFNLRECIEDSFDLFVGNQNRTNIDLYYDLSGIPQNVIGDITRFRQVLINLLGNAIKFTEQGEVFLSCRVLSTEEQDVVLEFSVKDTGIGITEEKQQRLFNAFVQADASTTREFGGTGLGLSICKSLVNAMGGEIGVKSKANQGSEFIFTVNFKLDPEPQHSSEQDYVNAIQGKTVLLVDNNPKYLKILASQCEQWGLQAITVDGLDKAKSALLTNPPEMILTGISISSETETDFIHWYNKEEKYTHIPLILLHTGLVDGRINEVSNDEFSELLIKPVKRNQLLKVLYKYLNKSGVSDGKVLTDTGLSSLAEEHPGQILVVEDNQVNQKIISRMLSKLGYQVDMAANGLESLDYVKKQDYDLVFMDVQMPKMDGLDATRAIRLLELRQPNIVALTANAVEGDRERCIESGMNDYLSKPLTIENLKATLIKHLSH